jgi:hypothetical protein
MRSVRLIAVAVLAVMLALSSAMPASADVNLLQNPGFETGEMDPWETETFGGQVHEFDVLTFGHTGAYSAIKGAESDEGGAWIRQEIEPACAEYLEFWYSGGFGNPQEHPPGDMELRIYYSDATVDSKDFPESPSNVWVSVNEDLDTTKLVEAVEVRIGGWVELAVDDFDLEATACTAHAVGGVVIPANTFAMLLPWLAVIGLVGCIGTVVVVAKKRRS